MLVMKAASLKSRNQFLVVQANVIEVPFSGEAAVIGFKIPYVGHSQDLILEPFLDLRLVGVNE